MSTKTIYTCDSCKQESEHSKLWTVRVYASHSMGFGNDHPVSKIDVCRPCLEKLGIHDCRPDELKAAEPAPESAADLMRKLIAMAMP